MQKILLHSVLFVFAIAAVACGNNSSAGSSGGGADDVAAVVNGSKVLVKDVDRVIAQQFRGQESQLSQLALAAYRLQALDTMINDEVLYQRAQKENINPTDDEVKQAVQSFKQERGLTEEAFADYLKQTNQTEEQFRELAKRQLAVSKLYEKLGSQLKVQEREVADVFNANPKQFALQPGVYISDIIIDPGNNGTKFDAVGEPAAEQRIREIQTRLKNGSDFATVARQLSEHESFKNSGDLGFLAKEQFGGLPQMMGLPVALGDRLMGMKEGDITEPVKDANGRWHIFKLTGKQTETRDRTLDEVRKEISDAILTQRKQIADAALQARARDEAKIENNLAQRMLENPNNFGVLRPAPGAGAASSPAASPAAGATPKTSAEASATPKK
ncbi:MAG TPA: SurA N-terminal domain-containing protein [Blastocatellia bacterium]|nr:SurA N-terminal domain-containing protein [Blastocatellia bacterium]HMY73775.1 SurA N-terminal domain-containing protein [Blastocatellia bacterium]